MTEKKPSKSKAPPLKQAGATQRMSKDELAELLKKAEAEDPDKQADSDDDDDDKKKPAATSTAKKPTKK